MNSNNGSLISHHRPRTRRYCAAFTLAEILIASGITAAMVLMLGWTLGTVMRAGSHASARVDAFRDARAALQLMERDLRNLVRNQWSPDPFSNPTPASTPQPVTLPAAYFAFDKLWRDVVNDPYSDPNNASPNFQVFGLVTTKSSASPSPIPSAGDLSAVGYYCSWDCQPNNQLCAYSLRRFFRNIDVQQALQGLTYAGEGVLYTPRPSDDPVLAAYVWNLKVTMYDSAGIVINTYPYICDPSAATPKALPAAIEISFNAMSPQAARTVMSVSSSPADWMDPTNPNYQRLILPHKYEFRTRISLQ